MTPEQRRTIYGHLNDALPSLRAGCTAFGGSDALYHRKLGLSRAIDVIRWEVEQLQKEMDDAASDV